MDSKKMGYRINDAMQMRNLLQKDLAKILGVTDNTISYYCSGSRTPRLEHLVQIADALDVTTDYLLGLTNDPERVPSVADELGLDARALKRVKSFKGSPGMDLLNIILGSNNIGLFLHALYMYTQACSAELIYAEHKCNGVENLEDYILQISRSGKYNGTISSYLRQMVRFNCGQFKLMEDDDFDDFCDFDAKVVMDYTHGNTQAAFEGFVREINDTMMRPIRRELGKEREARKTTEK